MQLTLTGKQVDIGNALRQHVEAELESILAKYFKTAIEAHVVIAKEAHLTRTEISLHIGRGIEVNASAARNDAYPAFDAAAERVAKQLRRYKRRLRDHHAQQREAAEPVETARDYTLAPPADEDTDEPQRDGASLADEDTDERQRDGAPTVIAEISTELPRLTVGEAVMRMDLADIPVLLFRNRAHGELNLVYRRADGNIGWVDPALDPARDAQRREGSLMADGR
jgi:ribosomal subunit interface protein